MKDLYVHCYLSGRCDEYQGEPLDVAVLVEKVNSGVALRTCTHDAATRAITAEMDIATKAAWLKDNADVIKDIGGDSEKAWRLYTQGRADALAHDLEVDVLEAISDEEEEEPDDDDDDSDDDSDEEDDDAEDDDDEDEEP